MFSNMRVIAVQRHRLVGVGEIAIVAIRARRNARGDRGIQLRRIEAPLFARIAAEEFLVQLPPDGVDHHIFGRA